METATDNPAVETTDNPSGEPEVQTNGTGANSGQASEATPTDDLFKGIDPQKLPPEVKSHYDSMLRDYREKTGSISERIKAETARATAAYQKEAEAYRQIAQNEDFVKQWNEYVQKAQSQGQDPNTDPKLQALEQKFEEIHQKIQFAETNQVMDAFADAKNEKGVLLHPDFDELNGLSISKDQNGEDLSLLNLCVKLAPGSNASEKLANGYRQAKLAYNSIFEAGKKAGMGRLQAKVQNGSLPPTSASGETLTVTEKRPKNAREAIAMARQGQVVSRD